MNLDVSYSAGPPLKIASTALFGQGQNTLKPACFPKACDVVRLWDDSTGLNVVAVAKGSFNWTVLDQRVAMILAAGKKIIYTFGNTPEWAAMLGIAGPVGAAGPNSNRAPVLSLIEPVIAAIVTRYKGKIFAYESWNENNAPNFYCGTKAQLLAWQQALYLIVKQVDPAALVTTPSPAYSSTMQDVEIASLLDLRFHFYSDVISFHGYWKNGQPGGAIGPVIANIRAAMAKVNCAFPLWDTEFGFSGQANGQNLFTPLEQRQWVIDAYMTRLNYGVSLLGWYQWDNLTHSPGITDWTGATLTPAGQAMVDLYAGLRG